MPTRQATGDHEGVSTFWTTVNVSWAKPDCALGHGAVGRVTPGLSLSRQPGTWSFSIGGLPTILPSGLASGHEDMTRYANAREIRGDGASFRHVRDGYVYPKRRAVEIAPELPDGIGHFTLEQLLSSYRRVTVSHGEAYPAGKEASALNAQKRHRKLCRYALDYF